MCLMVRQKDYLLVITNQFLTLFQWLTIEGVAASSTSLLTDIIKAMSVIQHLIYQQIYEQQ